MALLDIGAHRFQPFQMQIDWPGSNSATSGSRDTSPAETGNKRPEHQKGGAHGFDQIIRSLEVSDAVRLHFQLSGAIKPMAALHPFADAGKKPQGRPDISEMRNLLVETGLDCQQG